jgi:hypothetical protein
MRLECKCWTHTKCLAKYPENFEKCPRCLGLVDTNIQRYNDKEADSFGGRDYIKEPLPDSYFTSFKRSVSRNKEPFKWIAERSPLDWIINEKGYGLQQMISAGVSFQDFMDAGYCWSDLKTFKDFGDPKRIERARQALFALKCNAEHLRDYPHLLGSMMKDLQITGQHLCELYGLGFEPNTCKPLAVAGGVNLVPWKAEHLVKLGFKMNDLFGAGIKYLEQYADLQPTNEDEEFMGVQDADLAILPSVEELMGQRAAANVEPPPAATRIPHQPIQQEQPIPPRIQLPPVIVKYGNTGKQLHGLKKKNEK